MLIFDAETDGFLENVTKVHCLNLIDTATGKAERYTDHATYHDGSPSLRTGTLADALARLGAADEIGGQNIIKYDLPVLEKLFGWTPPASVKIRDTRVEGSVIWPNLADNDFAALRKGRLPAEFQKRGLIGTQKLEAWGYRLGLYKGDFDPKDHGYTWTDVPFLKEMDDYCEQDCVVTKAWFELIDSKGYSQECLDLETEVALIIAKQERDGFAFDVPAAEKLYASLLKQRVQMEEELRSIFPPWEVVTKRAISKVNNKKLGRVKGEPYEVRKTMVFNPGSRDHIADRLMTLRGWRPDEYTPKGKPKVDEAVLSVLPYPEAKRLAEYFTVIKRMGQLHDGKNGWLKMVAPGGRIHGTVNTNGTVTGRMSHARPNVAQTDKWEPMRALWVAPEGRVLVGCDAEGLELRMLGHYMARYDGGEYANAVVNGRKEDGTDVHTVNQHGVGLNHRDSAKTFIYALVYGAGDYKLGTVVYEDMTEDQKARFDASPGATASRDRALASLGKARRARLMKKLPALAKLVAAVQAASRQKGFLRGLDGRLLHVRSAHSALNTLLQSAGAIAMKKALVLLDEEIASHPSRLGNALFVANVHDEFQMETDPSHAEQLGARAADAIRHAGEHFNLRCPLGGAFDIGPNWSATH